MFRHLQTYGCLFCLRQRHFGYILEDIRLIEHLTVDTDHRKMESNFTSRISELAHPRPFITDVTLNIRDMMDRCTLVMVLGWREQQLFS